VTSVPFIVRMPDSENSHDMPSPLLRIHLLLPITSKLWTLCYLGDFKAAKRRQPHDLGLDFPFDHIIQISHPDEIATTSFTVGGSWEQTGFDYVKRDNTFYFYLNKHKIRLQGNSRSWSILTTLRPADRHEGDNGPGLRTAESAGGSPECEDYPRP
jgi:hypothetical protein